MTHSLYYYRAEDGHWLPNRPLTPEEEQRRLECWAAFWQDIALAVGGIQKRGRSHVGVGVSSRHPK